MPNYIEPSPRAMQASQIGQAFGQGVAKNFPDPQQLVNRQQLLKSLQEAKMGVRDPNATPLDKIFSFMEAGAGIPGSERYMGALLPLVQELSQAEAAQKAPFGGPAQGGNGGQGQVGQGGNGGQGQQQGGGQKKSPEIKLQNFIQSPQQNQFYPSNVGGQESPGNLPQAATRGVKQPVASNQNLLEMAKPYAAQKTAAGIPTTPSEAYEELKAINADNVAANKLVEQERQERVASQREYGQIAANKLSEVMPDASGEEVAYIKKQVEQLAGENSSEADIERLASAEARKYKNMIAKVSESTPATRSYNKPYQDIMGTSKSAEAARKDLRIKVQPLLDAGLYDKARNVLSERGYYPEEREMIITDLGENSLKTVRRMPAISGSASSNEEDGYSVKDKNMIQQNIKETLTADPSTNLILLRRMYELDKNVDWRTFKDTINEAIDEGVFKPNDDQFNQLNNLDQPPLGYLDKILYALGITGR